LKKLSSLYPNELFTFWNSHFADLLAVDGEQRNEMFDRSCAVARTGDHQLERLRNGDASDNVFKKCDGVNRFCEVGIFGVE
jgi:hypothetical protein